MSESGADRQETSRRRKSDPEKPTGPPSPNEEPVEIEMACGGRLQSPQAMRRPEASSGNANSRIDTGLPGDRNALAAAPNDLLRPFQGPRDHVRRPSAGCH